MTEGNGDEPQVKRLQFTKKQKKLHIHIALLSTGWIRWELHQTILVIMGTERRFTLSSMPYTSKGIGRPVDSNCNRVVRDRPKDADYVLIVGEDCVPPIGIFDVLADLQANKEELPDIVGYPVPIWRGTNTPPTVAINIKPLDKEEEMLELRSGLTEREVIGSGVFLISKQVMDDPAMRGAFFFIYDEDGVMQQSEDHTFCKVARENGYKVWSADGYICDHVQELSLMRVREAIRAAEVGVDALYSERRGEAQLEAEDGEAETSMA